MVFPLDFGPAASPAGLLFAGHAHRPAVFRYLGIRPFGVACHCAGRAHRATWFRSMGMHPFPRSTGLLPPNSCPARWPLAGFFFVRRCSDQVRAPAGPFARTHGPPTRRRADRTAGDEPNGLRPSSFLSAAADSIGRAPTRAGLVKSHPRRRGLPMARASYGSGAFTARRLTDKAGWSIGQFNGFWR